MKIFIIGLEKSGRTTVARKLAENIRIEYVHASGWIRTTFRTPRIDEKPDDYSQAYLEFYVDRIKQDPNLIVSCVKDIERIYGECQLVVDGIESPRDFTHLFNFNEDLVVFLNRIDMPETVPDYAGIGINVMRDYCLYLASIGLLPRSRWLEYNFKIPGEESDFVKQLGKHNTVTLTKSINKAIQHLTGELCELNLIKKS